MWAPEKSDEPPKKKVFQRRWGQGWIGTHGGGLLDGQTVFFASHTVGGGLVGIVFVRRPKRTNMLGGTGKTEHRGCESAGKA